MTVSLAFNVVYWNADSNQRYMVSACFLSPFVYVEFAFTGVCSKVLVSFNKLTVLPVFSSSSHRLMFILHFSALTHSSGTSRLGPTISVSSNPPIIAPPRNTHMFNDTPTLPAITIHRLPKTARPIVQPALRIPERCPQRGDALRSPYRR
jgi:hypothetical protein